MVPKTFRLVLLSMMTLLSVVSSARATPSVRLRYSLLPLSLFANPTSGVAIGSPLRTSKKRPESTLKYGSPIFGGPIYVYKTTEGEKRFSSKPPPNGITAKVFTSKSGKFSIYYSPKTKSGDKNAEVSKLITITCSEPKGIRFYKTGNKILQGDDGYTGITPKFILDQDNPKKLLVLFSASKPFGKSHNDDAQSAIIIKNNEKQLTAIEVKPLETWMYSFFPKEQVGFFSRHSTTFASIHGTTFYSKCTFSKSQ